MYISQTAAQNAENARTAIVLIALCVVVFWRIALRALLTIVLVMVGVGAIVLLQEIHR